MDLTEQVEAVRRRMRRVGFVPKCSSPVGAGRWLMVYENPHAPMSARFFVGVYEQEIEVLRHTYSSDLRARKDFERRVEDETP